MIFSRKNKLSGELTLTGALIFGAPVFALADKAPDPSEIQGPVRKPQEENKAVQKNGDSDNLSGKTDGTQQRQGNRLFRRRTDQQAFLFL